MLNLGFQVELCSVKLFNSDLLKFEGISISIKRQIFDNQ